MNVQILTNRLLQLPSQAICAATDVLLCQRSKPALDLIQPRRRGGCEADMKSWMPREPDLDGECFVRAVVIHNKMRAKLRRHVDFDRAIDNAIAIEEYRSFHVISTEYSVTNSYHFVPNALTSISASLLIPFPQSTLNGFDGRQGKNEPAAFIQKSLLPVQKLISEVPRQYQIIIRLHGP